MKRICTILAVLTTLLPFQTAFGEQQQKPRGFLFYDDKQLPVIKTQPKKKQPEMQPETKVSGSPQPAQQPAQPQPELFSVAWLQHKMPILLENAMNNPTDENVRAYKYAEKMMMDKASNFANTSERVVRNDPMLDESVRFPITAAARSNALWQVDKAREEIIKDLSQDSGLWFFFDSQCRFCETQYKVVKILEQKYNFSARYISIDGKLLKGMEQEPKNKIRKDIGGEIAKGLGIKLTPAVLLIHPDTQSVIIVAHGASAADEVEYRMVTAAIEHNLANPELVKVANLEKRGILTPQDIESVKQQVQNPDDPNELVKLINQAAQKRM
ncbi:MAG: conjugal transfer protein TraF [Neisseriaceae bacterium]|nr:conjugal transfer protein TraF [Neisseriaceae bacterium]